MVSSFQTVICSVLGFCKDVRGGREAGGGVGEWKESLGTHLHIT
jgi:hypothetical protein